MANKSKYFGFMDHLKVFIKNDKADKSKLIDWLDRYNELTVESGQLDQLENSLPLEIDSLLASGSMEDKTIEELAKKRAHLDLLPARQDKIDKALRALDREFESANAYIEEAVRKSIELYYNCQLEVAISDLKKLGVSDEIAKQQAVLREDIQFMDPWRLVSICCVNTQRNDTKARALLWAFESYEAGFHPDSPEAAKFKKRWKPNA